MDYFSYLSAVAQMDTAVVYKTGQQWFNSKDCQTVLGEEAEPYIASQCTYRGYELGMRIKLYRLNTLSG